MIALRPPVALDLSPALRAGLAVGSGLLCAAAFPPWDVGPVAFVGLVPLWLALEGAAGRGQPGEVDAVELAAAAAAGKTSGAVASRDRKRLEGACGQAPISWY